MGAIPKFGQERLAVAYFGKLLKLVCFILFLTAFCLNYCANSLVPTSVGITWREAIAAKQYFSFRDLKSRTHTRKSAKFKGPTWIGNPAFGGRGAGILQGQESQGISVQF